MKKVLTKILFLVFSKDGDKNVVLLDDTFEPYLYVMSDDLDGCINEIQDNLYNRAKDFNCRRYSWGNKR